MKRDKQANGIFKKNFIQLKILPLLFSAISDILYVLRKYR